MIKVQDWIASIPDEEKHIAYVGEGLTEQRVFYLTGGDWEKYRNWTFHLDMAFDPESKTTRDSRQVVQTTKNYKKTASETGISTEEVTTKETFALDSETVDADGLTDVALLTRRVMDDGIQLTWTVLRQQTQYPGKLWATIRAMGDSTDKVKKSAVMVFEVEPAVSAMPAKPPTVNEFQQMEADLNVYYQNAMNMLDAVNVSAESAHSAASGASWYADQAAQSAAQVEQSVATVLEAVDNAQSAEKAASADATAAAEHHRVVVEEADAAKDACATAKAYMLEALVAAQDAADSYVYAEEETMKCEEYTQQCADYVSQMANAVDNLSYNRVNVRDYGAVGDGVTNDQPAIWAAWQAARALVEQDIPCELYFPAGIYGILEGGLGFGVPRGKGNLRITGAGREITTIQYLEDWKPNSKYGGAAWYAVDVHPEGGASFWNYDTYIHDVAITGLTIRDDYPDKHATHTAKGTATTVTGGEENHGINIGYCVRAAVTDCNLINLGDEVVDIYSCEDTIVMNNHIEGCPAAGPGGGAITIADGSKGAVVSGNTIVRTGADYVLTAEDFGGADGITVPAGAEMSGSVRLPDGTVIGRYTKLTQDTFIPVGTTIIKSNYAVAVESLYIPVSDVVITGNTIRDMHGKAMNLGCPNEGSAIINVVISDNVMSGCDDGIRLSGTYPKRSVKIHNNIFADIAGGAIEANAIEDITVCGNTFRNIGGACAIGANGFAGNSRQLYANNVFEDIKYSAIVTAGMVLLKDCLFNGVGTGAQPATPQPAITKQSGTLKVSGCVMKNVRISSTSGGGGGVKSGIQGADVVEHTDIELITKSGAANAGGDALTSGGSVIGGKLGGRITVTKENAVVQGVTVVSTNIGSHAITVATNGVSVMGCNIHVNTAASKGAIGESSGCNHNLFANNITNRPIYTVGANTVAVNNINTSATA